MFPVDFIKLLVWPRVFLPVAQILSRHFLACMKPDRMRYVIGNFVPPNYYCDILFGQQLGWPIVVTLRHCQSHGLFGECVTYAIELLDKGQLVSE